MRRQPTIPDIRTQRLCLVVATTAHLNAEILGIQFLAGELNAEIPRDWPPEHYDNNVINYVINFLQQNPEQAEWSMRYIVAHDLNPPTLVGGCGYKGKPNSSGVVEIGYGLTPMFQKQGYATEAARALIEYAFANPNVHSVIAHTLPDHRASIGVMLRSGMKSDSETTEDGEKVVRYVIDRKTYRESPFSPTSI